MISGGREAARAVLFKKLFLEILQNSQENTCARVSFLIKLLATLLKKRLWYRRFPVNFVEFLRTSFLQNTSGHDKTSLENFYHGGRNTRFSNKKFFCKKMSRKKPRKC